MAKVTVYGASDDLIEMEGDFREEFSALNEWKHSDDGVGGFVIFSDGSVIKVIYDHDGIWRLTPYAISLGTRYVKTFEATSCEGEDFSDQVTLENESDFFWAALATTVVKDLPSI